MLFRSNSYLEILYRSFGIATPEFHILLYGLLQQNYNRNNNIFESSIKMFDVFLNGISNVQHKTWEHMNKNGIITTYETLPTFIRNKIDHPEAKNPMTMIIYKYTEKELKNSIDFLLNQL